MYFSDRCIHSFNISFSPLSSENYNINTRETKFEEQDLTNINPFGKSVVQ